MRKVGVIAAATALALGGGVVAAPGADAGPRVTVTCTTQRVTVGLGDTPLLLVPVTKCVPSVACDGSCVPDLPLQQKLDG